MSPVHSARNKWRVSSISHATKIVLSNSLVIRRRVRNALLDCHCVDYRMDVPIRVLKMHNRVNVKRATLLVEPILIVALGLQR